MKKLGILAVIVLLMAMTTAIRAEGANKQNNKVSSVSIAEPDSRAGGLPKIEVDEKIKDCGCPPCCDKNPADDRGRVVIILNVQFDTDKSVVKEEYYDDISRVADFMKEFSDKKAVIEGYTDDVGNEEYNRKLSERRAESVRQILMEKYGIESSRISAVGYGEDNPVASNDTAEGRQQNRRIEAVIEAVRGNL